MKKQVQGTHEALIELTWRQTNIPSLLALVCMEPEEFQTLMLLSYCNLDFITMSLISFSHSPTIITWI